MQLFYVYDFFRPDYKNAKRFIYDIMNASVKASFHKEILYIEDSNYIDFEKFYALANFNPKNKEFWVENYYELSKDVEEYLLSVLPKDAIYFSHEAPDWLIKLLSKAGLKYIDVRLSYIRFMRDIPLLLSTNIDSVREKFYSYQIPKEEITYEADILSARIRFRQIKEKFPAFGNSLVVLGQMHHDISLMTHTHTHTHTHTRTHNAMQCK